MKETGKQMYLGCEASRVTVFVCAKSYKVCFVAFSRRSRGQVDSLKKCNDVLTWDPNTRGYEKEEHAAEAYDVAAMKCKGGKAGRKVRGT